MKDLHSIAESNLVTELESALKSGADINVKDRFGVTPLHCSISGKSEDVAKALLARGADVTLQDNEGRTPLHWAIEYKLPEIARAIVRENPKAVSIADMHGNEPLWTAAFNARGKYDLVEFLLAHGADVNHRNAVGLCPLDIPRRKAEPELLAIMQGSLSRTAE